MRRVYSLGGGMYEDFRTLWLFETREAAQATLDRIIATGISREQSPEHAAWMRREPGADAPPSWNGIYADQFLIQGFDLYGDGEAPDIPADPWDEDDLANTGHAPGHAPDR